MVCDFITQLKSNVNYYILYVYTYGNIRDIFHKVINCTIYFDIIKQYYSYTYILYFLYSNA